MITIGYGLWLSWDLDIFVIINMYIWNANLYIDKKGIFYNSKRPNSRYDRKRKLLQTLDGGLKRVLSKSVILIS